MKAIVITALIAFALGATLTCWLESRVANPTLEDLQKAHQIAQRAVTLAERAQGRSRMYREMYLKAQQEKYSIAICMRCHEEG